MHSFKNSALLFMVLCLPIFVRCASLSEAGEKVTHVTDKKQITGCKSLGKVTAEPPYSLPSDWKKKLRNAAGALGANYVYGDTDGLKSTVNGEAYLCP
jgi:hypothetical protein